MYVYVYIFFMPVRLLIGFVNFLYLCIPYLLLKYVFLSFHFFSLAIMSRIIVLFLIDLISSRLAWFINWSIFLLFRLFYLVLCHIQSFFIPN